MPERKRLRQPARSAPGSRATSGQLSPPQIALTEDEIQMIARRFRTLGEPMRLRILQVLESGEYTVREIVERLGGEQSNTSRHLLSLFKAGLVGRRQFKNNVYYWISDPVVFKLCELVCRGSTDSS
jgi:DNA-binding transcriptional ArsR family regulator